jgi:hypothetical protein
LHARGGPGLPKAADNQRVVDVSLGVPVEEQPHRLGREPGFIRKKARTSRVAAMRVIVDWTAGYDGLTLVMNSGEDYRPDH